MEKRDVFDGKKEDERDLNIQSDNLTYSNDESEETGDKRSSIADASSEEYDYSVSDGDEYYEDLYEKPTHNRVYKELEHVKDEIGVALTWALSIFVLLFAILYYSFFTFIVVSILVIIFNSLECGTYLSSISRRCLAQRNNNGIGPDCMRIFYCILLAPWGIVLLVKRWFWVSVQFVAMKVKSKRFASPSPSASDVTNVRTE